MNKGNKRWATWLCMILAVTMLAACTGNSGSGETAGSTNRGNPVETSRWTSRCLPDCTMKFPI